MGQTSSDGRNLDAATADVDIIDAVVVVVAFGVAKVIVTVELVSAVAVGIKRNSCPIEGIPLPDVSPFEPGFRGYTPEVPGGRVTKVVRDRFSVGSQESPPFLVSILSRNFVR